jgi:hypothetical protein
VQATAFVVESEILLVEVHGCDFFPDHASSCAYAVFLVSLCAACCAGDCVWEAIPFGLARPFLTSYREKWTACEAEATQACSASLLTANGGGTKMVVCRSLALVDAVLGSAAVLLAAGWNRHGESVIANVQDCDSWVVWLACAESWVMRSDSDGVSRMASCRDGDGGGGVDVSAKPCPDWVPFSSVDGARPWTLRDCADVPGPDWSSCRVNGRVRASSKDECRCRWCDVWRSPSRRVARATLAWGR